MCVAGLLGIAGVCVAGLLGIDTRAPRACRHMIKANLAGHHGPVTGEAHRRRLWPVAAAGACLSGLRFSVAAAGARLCFQSSVFACVSLSVFAFNHRFQSLMGD